MKGLNMIGQATTVAPDDVLNCAVGNARSQPSLR